MGRLPLFRLAKTYPRYVFVFAVLLVALSLSCPVKNSLKTLAGIPTKTEQNAAKGAHTFVGNNIEQCVNSTTTEATTSMVVTGESGQVLPTAFFIAAFLFLLGITGSREKLLSRYEDSALPPAVPLFLRYRKLII